ncbi:glycosyltransferase [Saccharicrinis aurantiacus]|uniref:glycosyltransferase n=1 Tax=Saccharicrinis aurantiacus TaxID=1849719 RepID=UPI002490EEB0|nr:glycosyltransferase [Saccharicrinis aurantiacus]
MNNFAPIALFTYNRLDHTKKTIEALANNKNALKSSLFIFSDGAKTESDIPLIKKLHNYLNTVTGFKDVKLIISDTNKGLAHSIIEGVTSIFKTHNEVIVLEDDLVTTPGFINFMNKALQFYNPNKIWSIAGYTPPIKLETDYSFDSYLAPRNCSWGWATWKKNWLNTDWDINDFKSFIESKEKQILFNAGGNDLTTMLLKQQQKVINSWSIRFNYGGFKAQKPSVYPSKSLINNIGIDGSGTHMKKTSRYNSELENVSELNYNFCPDNLSNPIIQSRFKRFYDTSLQRKLINWFKIKLAKYTLS